MRCPAGAERRLRRGLAVRAERGAGLRGALLVAGVGGVFHPSFNRQRCLGRRGGAPRGALG